MSPRPHMMYCFALQCPVRLDRARLHCCTRLYGLIECYAAPYHCLTKAALSVGHTIFPVLSQASSIPNRDALYRNPTERPRLVRPPTKYCTRCYSGTACSSKIFITELHIEPHRATLQTRSVTASSKYTVVDRQCSNTNCSSTADTCLLEPRFLSGIVKCL